MNRFLFPALAIALATAGGSATAQTLTPSDADSVVARVERLAHRYYGFPEKVEPLVAALRAAQTSGRYAVTNPVELAVRMATDMAAATRDSHVDITWDPEAAEAMFASEGADPTVRTADQLRDDRLARLRNHGLDEMRVLPGNVRYLRIRGFTWRADVTGAVYDAAMRFLRDGDAVIIDLRGNGGGDGSAVRYAISHFMPADTEQLLVTFREDDGRPLQSRSLSYLPAGRITAPLYVLVDRGSASASEEFALHVEKFGLGTLVGETTAGAGNSNGLFPVAPGFVLSFPLYRPPHGLDGTNVEGVGVRPQIEIEPERALEAAHAAALETLAARADESDRFRLEWELELARARANPPEVTPAELERYVGVYGERRVWLEGNALVYQREGRDRLPLIPLGDDRFGLLDGTQARVRFVTDGQRATAIELYYSDGMSSTAVRTE